MNILKVSSEKLEAAMIAARNFYPECPDGLKAPLDIVCSAAETIICVRDLIRGNCNIQDIRKFLNIFPEKKETDQDNKDASAKESSNHSKESAKEDGADNGSDREKPVSKEKPDPNKNKNHKGRQAASNFEVVKETIHHVAGHSEGDTCDHCGGTYYHRERRRIWFEESSPLVPTHQTFHDLVCNLCKNVIKAEPSKELIADGFEKEERFGYGAIAFITIMKYFEAIPWYRFTNIHCYFNIHIPESTLWDQVVKMADAQSPIYVLFQKLTANCPFLFGDDTFNRILAKEVDIKPNRRTGNSQIRDGCHSSVITGIDNEGHHIVNVVTDIIYLGEWLDKILAYRDKNLPPPMIMSDGSNQNRVTVIDVVNLDCNQHARDQFDECKEHFPEQVKEVLHLYKKIFENDQMTRTMTPLQRLAYHKANSEALFEQIATKIQGWIDAKISPENSAFGAACAYFLARKESLKAFFTLPGAALCNNLSERQMVKIALLRNVCKHFRTEYSAKIASIIFSVGLTVLLTPGVNMLDYFKVILRFSDEVKKRPEAFLPWNYQDTVKKLSSPDG